MSPLSKRGSISQTYRRSLDEAGGISISLMVFASILTTSFIGLVGTWKDWNDQVEHQYRMDRCVSGYALEARHWMNRIRDSNQQIEITRALMIPAALKPPLFRALKGVLQGIVVYQDVLNLKQRLHFTKWIALRGCDSEDLPLSFPKNHWVRPPPDSLGPKPLRWSDRTKQPRIDFKLLHYPRSSAAEVVLLDGQYRARWSHL